MHANTSYASYQTVQEAFPDSPLFRSEWLPWTLSPEPYWLNKEQVEKLEVLGQALYHFQLAVEKLYIQSAKTPSLGWIRSLFNAGKPEELLEFSRLNRTRKETPLILRPDLLVTEGGNFALTEIDSVPGGIGFTHALLKTYSKLGFKPIGSPETFATGFIKALKQLTPTLEEPVIAIVVSDEAQDYREELTYFTEASQYAELYCIHPKQLLLQDEQLGFYKPSHVFCPIDTVYRFFELFDWPNIQNGELLQIAIKKGWVICSPPFKPVYEEKLALSLLFHQGLQDWFEAELSAEEKGLLRAVIPETWVLDPSAVPHFAKVTPELVFNGKHFSHYQELMHLTQKQRELVLKPSGFSEWAWGSRGVKIGHDLPQVQWQHSLEEALNQFSTSPWVMQRFSNTMLEPYSYFENTTSALSHDMGRTRLCPYYFIENGKVTLQAILSTTCPKNKKIIHGMKDGVLRVAAIKPYSPAPNEGKND
jgi:hypothetical protein